MDVGLPLVMVHENDPERGGCEFSEFFKTTPEDLLHNGIYKKLAVVRRRVSNRRPCRLPMA